MKTKTGRDRKTTQRENVKNLVTHFPYFSFLLWINCLFCWRSARVWIRSGHVTTTILYVGTMSLVVTLTLSSIRLVFEGEQLDLGEARAMEDGAPLLFQSLRFTAESSLSAVTLCSTLSTTLKHAHATHVSRCTLVQTQMCCKNN